MTLSQSTDTVRSYCDALAVEVLRDAITNFRSELNDQLVSDKVKTMNGTVLTNHVNHLDNFKKLEENLITSEKVKDSSKDNAGATLHEKDKKKLGMIQEEAKKDNDSSGEDISSLTSDTDSDSDVSLDDSTEEEVEFFPAKRGSHLKQFDATQNQIHSPATSKDTASLPSNDSKNSNDIIVNGGNTEDSIDQGNQYTGLQNKLPLKLSPLSVSGHNNGGRLKDQVDGTSESIPTTSSSYGEPSTSGSSDIIIPSAHNPPDLIKGNLNSSGTVSDDSDLKDHARILAELQKIVLDDELHDGHGQSNDGNSQINQGDENNNGAKVQNDVTKNNSHTSNQHDGNNSTMKSLLANNLGTSIDGHTKAETNQNNDDGNTDGAANFDRDGGNVGNGTQGNGTSSNSILHGTADSSKQGGDVVKNDTLHGPQTNKKPEITSASKTTPTQPANFANQDHSGLENLERKLSNLQISNKEQTEEIRRLKDLNETLKTKFEKLEQSSSHNQNIEERMLQRNEELEKHLLGMLKSQEIIFEMKENLKAASADNAKLSNDYKEAVKALEAVDKLFGQKDALVKKWKEATEESRNLVELLKKHNAELGDLETVDKLKEEIVLLKDKVSKAEERNRAVDTKNAEFIEQSKTWKEKYERENEQRIRLDFELEEVLKELKNHQKLAGKRGRRNQMLQLEITELKDTLKIAKEKLVENERRLKELERKYADTQETYTKIIHEKEKQHSVLIKNSESHQKDLVANIANAEILRKEAKSLKDSIVVLEKDKIEVAEKLRNNEKSLEETLNKKVELSEQLAKLQADFEAAKIEAVDNELYTEEQTVRLQELDEQCRQLQQVLKQYIHSNGNTRGRRLSAAPGRYNRGRKSKPSQTWPGQLDMYKQLLSPPRGMPKRKTSARREARYRVQITDKNDSEDTFDDVTKKYDESSKPMTFHPNRPRSTYGNRSLSTNNIEGSHHDHHSEKDWVPKIVLVDSQKLESSSEHDSGSVSADQYAMQYVKLGDRVLLELPVEGKKQNISGTVKYVGPVYHSNFKRGIYAGLKLDIPAGDTNGTVGERVYFHCLKNNGKFVKLAHILAVQNPRTQQYTRVLPMAYK
ncbi:desmoplakin-like [Dendronephthya gigantea]|uniref:desmoplakin-like n=1 Tax=Dendronephthya gigantea TaxID=151771 RepID=UPI00106AB09E|nr:desmoplakin-like [Dendronephthya gigantea]